MKKQHKDFLPPLSLFIVVVGVGGWGLSCTHSRPPAVKGADLPSPAAAPSEDVLQLQRVVQDMEKGQYARALTPLQALAQKHQKHPYFYWPVLFNLVSVHQNLGQCEQALKQGEKLLKVPAPLKMKAREYLLMAFVYECLSQPGEGLKVLTQGEKLSSLREGEVQWIEYPARRALMLLQAGRAEEAASLYQKIYSHLEERKKSFRVTEEADKAFARYFYLMGKSYAHPKWLRLPYYLRSFVHHQFYLTQAVLLEVKPWSERAEKELEHLYRRLWLGLKRHHQPPAHHRALVKKALNTLKTIVRKNPTSPLSRFYARVRRQTHQVLAGPVAPRKGVVNDD